MGDNNSKICFNSVVFHYEKSEENAINNVTLSINKGEFVAIVGQNGCGKSTIAKLFNGVFTPQSGKVLVDGMDTADENLKYTIRGKVGLVMQNPDNQLVASIVEEDVAFGPENLSIDPIEIRRRVDKALKIVGMYEHRLDAPHKLSGGQKQRVAIAGVLAMQPDYIILDEPTSMLDPQGRAEVLKTVQKLNKEKNITIILVTHYMNEAIQADRVIVMNKGSVVADDTPRNIFSNVELLKDNSLNIPQAVQLVEKLREKGYNLPKGVLDENECVATITQLLEEKNGNY